MNGCCQDLPSVSPNLPMADLCCGSSTLSIAYRRDGTDLMSHVQLFSPADRYTSAIKSMCTPYSQVLLAQLPPQRPAERTIDTYRAFRPTSQIPQLAFRVKTLRHGAAGEVWATIATPRLISKERIDERCADWLGSDDGATLLWWSHGHPDCFIVIMACSETAESTLKRDRA